MLGLRLRVEYVKSTGRDFVRGSLSKPDDAVDGGGPGARRPREGLRETGPPAAFEEGTKRAATGAFVRLSWSRRRREAAAVRDGPEVARLDGTIRSRSPVPVVAIAPHEAEVIGLILGAQVCTGR